MSRRNRPHREKSRLLSAIFAFTLGWAGVHKFYLRNMGAGFFYVFLMFMSIRILGMPISMLLGFIDGMRLLMMSEEEFDRKYNRNAIRRANKPAPASKRQRSRPSSKRGRSKREYAKVNPYKKSGIKKYKEFELEGAIEDFNKGLEIAPNDIALHFNLACAYSLTEQKEKGFHHLDQAVALGFKDLEKIKTHDDLAYLRIQPEFDPFKENGFRLEKQPGTNKVGQNEEVKDDVLLSQLNRLMELRKRGLLSEDEFVLERKKLLRRQ